MRSPHSPYNLTVWQGKTFTLSVTYANSDGTPIDLTGWTGRSQIRKRLGGTLMADFTVIINGPTGEVTLSLSETDSRAVTEQGIYDVELVNGATVIGLLRGDVGVIPEVTLP